MDRKRYFMRFLHVLTCNLDRHIKHVIVRRMHRNLRARQFAYLREHHPRLPDVACPICGGDDCRPVHYWFERNTIAKSFCARCCHVWSVLDLPRNTARAVELFNYKNPSRFYQTEKRIIVSLVRQSGLSQGRFLDFGIGGNLSALTEAAAQLGPRYQLFACDLPKRDGIANYFTTYQDDAKLGTFDGICSSEVIEHLDDTIKTWLYMNRLLRPIAQGGGSMLHVFPSNLDLHMNDTMVIIGSHICVFSAESLRVLCEKSGFHLARVSHRRFMPEFRFEKIRDV